MTLYRRILVPLDGSPVDDVVLAHVVRLAETFHSEVVLLRVAHFHTRDTMTHEVEDAQAVLARVAPRLAGKVTASCSPAGSMAAARASCGVLKCMPLSAATSRAMPSIESASPRLAVTLTSRIESSRSSRERRSVPSDSF